MASGFRIKLDDPGIDAGDERAAHEVLRSGQLVCGPRVAELERGLVERLGRRHAVCVSSGTAALYLAFQGLGVGPGGTVVVPALTFPAPAVAAAMSGAEVRVCDVDRDTLNLSVATLEPVLDERVSLVVAIDQFGNPAPVPTLEQLLTPRNIPLLVDAACSLGSTLNGRPCGSLGLAAVPLGIAGLVKAHRDPSSKGKVHAWVAIICGGIGALLWGGIWVVAIVAGAFAS